MSEWTPFQRRTGVVIDPDGVAGYLVENNRFQVIVREVPETPFGPMLHLTIRSTDGSSSRTWAEFQRIKNELASPEAEAVELYPAESRLVDTGSYYHLWVFTTYRFPFGMSERQVTPAHAAADGEAPPPADMS